MNIFPAIDIKDGKAVRLFQGDYDQMTVYSENPAEIAREFKDKGLRVYILLTLTGQKTESL